MLLLSLNLLHLIFSHSGIELTISMLIKFKPDLIVLLQITVFDALAGLYGFHLFLLYIICHNYKRQSICTSSFLLSM